MKKYLLLFAFLLVVIGAKAQKKGISLSLSAGYSIPLGDYAAYTIPSDTAGFPGATPYHTIPLTGIRDKGSQYNLDLAYFFGKFGMGLSYGTFNHKIKETNYEMDFTHDFNGGKIDGSYYGVGPQYGTSFGKFKIIGKSRVGMMNLKVDSLVINYTGTDVGNPINLFKSVPSSDSGNSVLYSSFGVQFSYAIIKNLSLFVKADYFTSLGKGIEVKTSYYQPADIDVNNEINAFDVAHFTSPYFKKEEMRFIKPEMLNIGVGLTYNIGGKSRRNHQDNIMDNAVEKESKRNDNPQNNVVTKSANSSDDDNEQRSKIYAGTNGEFEISNDQDPDGYYTFTPGIKFSGTGTTYLPFIASTVAVKFKNIKVDNQGHLILGKIIVKHNDDAPTYPRDWLLSAASTQVNNAVDINHDQVKDLMDWADDQTNNVPGLQYVGSSSNNSATPYLNNPAIKTPFILELDPNNDSRFAITEMVFLPTESKFNSVVAFDVPAEWNSTDEIGFISKGVKFHTNDIVGPTERFEIVSDILINNANNKIAFRFKKAAEPEDAAHPGCYIEWDETNGFTKFGIEINTEFTRSWLKPVPDDGTSKTSATLIGESTTSWDDVILQGHLEKSEIVAAHGTTIEANDLSFDMSDTMNPANIHFTSAYDSLPNTQTDNHWRGFFAKNVTVGLPDAIKASHQNGPIEITGKDCLIDNQGITMEVAANNLVGWADGKISDLNASIDTLGIDILTGTLIDYKIKGKINIPTSSKDSIQHPLAYTGYFIPAAQVANTNVIPDDITIPPNKSVLYLNISSTGDIYSDLLKGKIILDQNSEMFALKAGSLKYFDMNLKGKLKYDNVSLGNTNQTSSGNIGSNATYNSSLKLDGIDIEVEFEDLGFTYDSSKPDHKLSFHEPTWSLASPQKKIQGFPVTINNINYHPLPIDNDEDLHGQLDFDVIVNLSSNIGAAAGLGVEFNIKNDSINDERFKPKFLAVHMDSLAVNAHLAAVDINGNIFVKNDSIYGKGFGGGLSATFRGIGLSAYVMGQFGKTDYNYNNPSQPLLQKYRYWFVEAGADIPEPIVFLPGVAFYGFKGGACHNMHLDIDTTNPANIVQTYTPHKGNLGFKAGATIGTFPLQDVFNADVDIEAIFSTTGGGMQYIGFNGNFGTNADIPDRRNDKGTINGNLLVNYDFPNKHFYFGANATIDTPPLKTIPNHPVWLAYDNNGLQNKWFFKFGEPDYTAPLPNGNLNTVKINLSGIDKTLYEYFMFGNNLPHVSGFTQRFNDGYASAVGHAPDFGGNVGSTAGSGPSQIGTGIALGLGLKMDKNVNEHIKGKFYLNLGVNTGAEVNLMYMRYNPSCGYNPIGTNGWRASGSLGVYARASAEVQKIKNGSVKKTWTIIDLRGGAWMHGEFPNPYYVKGAVEGEVRVGCVNGDCLVNRSMSVEFEKGTSCYSAPNNATEEFEQEYATDQFDNNLIQHVAPDQNWNFPEQSPIAVRYNFVPDEAFYVAEQQADGSALMRKFKMEITHVSLVKASSVTNNIPHFASQSGINATLTNKFLDHKVNSIGEYQYILKPAVVSAMHNLPNAAIPNQNPVLLQNNATAFVIANPIGGNNNQQGGLPTISSQTLMASPVNLAALNAVINPPPYLNDLEHNTFYRFKVSAKMKEYNFTTQQWEDAHNTDGSVVQETFTKVFRTGPFLLPIFDGETIDQIRSSY